MFHFENKIEYNINSPFSLLLLNNYKFPLKVVITENIEDSGGLI